MVVPALIMGGTAALAGSAAGGAAAAGGGSILAGLFGSSLGQGAIGGILGGLGGGIFGGGKKTGFGDALNKSLFARSESLRTGVENFEKYGSRFLDSFASSSPVYGVLQQRVLEDLNDPKRTARLEGAFLSKLGSQQAQRGLYRSPSAALQSSFAGLQFQEQIRQQAFGNAMNFQSQLGQPLAAGFFQAGLPNIQGDIGFQMLANQIGQKSAQNQSIAGGISSGFNAGVGFSSLLG